MRLNSMLGELLIEKKLISPNQLERALSDQKETKEPLGQVLIRLGYISEGDLRMTLSEQLGISFLAPDQLTPRGDQRLKEIIPKEFALEHKILPLSREERALKIAASKMPDLIFLDNLRKMTGLDIVTVLSSELDIKRAIELYYSATDFQEIVSSSEVDEASQGLEPSKEETKLDLESAMAEAGQAPVVRLVDVMLKKALDDRASDIHIEPFHEKMNVRYRVDGALYELPPPPKELHSAVVSRIKILSKLDIAEKRIPQDGSFSISYKGRRVDVRVSPFDCFRGKSGDAYFGQAHGSPESQGSRV